METKVTSANFTAEVENSTKPVLVDFFATWCQPCRMIAPFVKEVAEERPDVKVCKVDIDENGALAGKFNIDSIPNLLLFKDGKLLGNMMGYHTKSDILSFIDSKLA